MDGIRIDVHERVEGRRVETKAMCDGLGDPTWTLRTATDIGAAGPDEALRRFGRGLMGWPLQWAMSGNGSGPWG